MDYEDYDWSGQSNYNPYHNDDDPPSELVKRVIACLQEWFNAIEDGTANDRLPDPNGRRFTEKETEEFIKVIDDYTEWEVTQHKDYHGRQGIVMTGVPMDLPTTFYELEGASREAFMQDVKEVYRKFREEQNAEHSDM